MHLSPQIINRQNYFVEIDLTFAIMNLVYLIDKGFYHEQNVQGIVNIDDRAAYVCKPRRWS